MKAVGIIPARYHSTRLEGKPLVDIHGRPMIQWVYENVINADVLDDVLVATDDQRIIEAVEQFGGKAVMTSKDHPTGTDRIAEAVKSLDVQVVINVQGDEPFITPTMINEVAMPLLEDHTIPMCTLMHEITEEDFQNPNVVKVVTDQRGFALYFSRSLIPFPRQKEGHHAFEHIGIYGYQKDFLHKLTQLEPTPLEKTEALEQLRVIENGFSIKVIHTAAQDYIPLSIDTKEDLEKARAIIIGAL
jgi:3-deoxy-manno-octulosonate cytidylyltransferase (CMP-KDO synthetase)